MLLLIRVFAIAGLQTIIRWTAFGSVLGNEQKNKNFSSVEQYIKEKLTDYDRFHMPLWSEGKPVKLFLGFYLESLSDFRETEMSFQIDMYLRMRWRDQRLSHNESRYILITDLGVIEKFWLPDVYIANAQKASFHDVTNDNRLLRIFPDGRIHYSVRVAATISCSLNLQYYPVDYQTCYIQMLSYGYNENLLVIDWFPDSKATSYRKDIELPELSILEILPDHCDGKYAFEKNYTYIFSCLKAILKVKREIGYHILQTYIPSTLIVIVSWASFWIDPQAVAARTGLCITTLLTITTQAAGLRSYLPPVSYAKAIDYWIGLCILMVFGSLFEYVIVSSRLQKGAGLAAEDKADGKLETEKITTFGNCVNGNLVADVPSEMELDKGKMLKRIKKKYTSQAYTVDAVSKFLFPCVFVAFNALYWLKFYCNKML